MNYFSHNIGDYRRDTSHLSLLEHGIYRQLIDWYYLDEVAIPKDTQVVFRRLSARTQEEQNSVIQVLQDFFQLTDAGYQHKRCEVEIAKYQENAEKNRTNGNLGGRPKKTQSVILGNPTESETEAKITLTNNHKPITNNQEQALEEVTNIPHDPSLGASVCLILKKQNILDVNPSHPTLLALLEAGASIEEFGNAAATAKVKKFNYILGMVKSQREQASKENLVKGSFKTEDNTWRVNEAKMVAKAKELGIGTSGLSKFDLAAKIADRIEQRKGVTA